MSTAKTPRPLAQIAAGLLVLAAITGIYLFQAEGRKAGPAPAAGAVAPAASGLSKDLATGALAAFLMKPERPVVADAAFQDATGKPLKVSDWKGRVALINLWATWCAPCRKEMPDLAKLQQQLGSPDFEVVAVSVDRKGAEASSAFLKETGADSLRLYVEPTTGILNEFQALGLPFTILVDRQGREIGRLLGPADWSSPEALALVKAALAEPK